MQCADVASLDADIRQFAYSRKDDVLGQRYVAEPRTVAEGLAIMRCG